MEDLNRDILKKEMRTIWKIWAACFHGLLAYVIVCHYLQKDVPYLKEYDLPLELLKYSFYSLSLIALFLCHHIRKNMLERTSIKSDLKIIERAKAVGKPTIIVKYTNIVFVAIAFSEGICLLGVVYFFLSGDYKTLYGLFAISAIAMLYYRPKVKDLANVTIRSEATLPSINKTEPGHSH